MMNRRFATISLVLALCCAAAFILFGTGDQRSDEPDAPKADPTAARAPGPLPDADAGDGEQEGDGGDAEEKAGAAAEEETEEEERFSFEKETPFSVAVRVLDPDGEPLECDVEILMPHVGWTVGKLPRKEKGRFEGFLPEEGRYAAEAIHEGTRLRSDFAVTAVEPRAEVEVRFVGTGVVSGAILSSRGSIEKSVEGEHRVLGQEDLTVELLPDGKPPEALLSCRVDASGGYRIGAVPAGAYLVRVKNKFHVSRVEVGENEHVVHDIRLESGRISGRVTDSATGEPLQTVQVVVQLSLPESPETALLRRAGFASVSARLVPDEAGRYAFTNLPAGEYRLFSNGRYHAPLRLGATITEEEDDVTLDFPLERGSSVDIAILDLEGEPLESPFWITQGIRCGFTGHVTGLRAGTHDFVVFGGEGYEVQVKEGVVFEPGKPTKLEFKMAAEAPTTLVFRDPEGAPLSGVRVSVMKYGRDLQPFLASFLRHLGLPLSITGADGRIAVRGVSSGAVRVVAKLTAYALLDKEIELAAGRSEIEFALEPADTVFTWRVRIDRVSPDSPAQKAGLLPGDVIVSYGGLDIDSVSALPRAIEVAKRGGNETAVVAVERDGKRFEVEVAPGVLGVTLSEFEEQ